MKTLLYEYFCGIEPAPECMAPIDREGLAMLESISRALSKSAGVDLSVLLHHRRAAAWTCPGSPLPLHGPAADWFANHAGQFDAVLPIAPESDGALTRICEAIASTGAAPLVPLPPFQRLFADKLATAEALPHWSLPTLPAADFNASNLPAAEDWIPFDVEKSAKLRKELVVLKPRDGFGAIQTFVCRIDKVQAQLQALAARPYVGETKSESYISRYIVQPYWPGIPCSVAIVADGKGNAITMMAVEQRIDHSPAETGIEALRYRGGKLIRDERLCRRVQSLGDYILDLFPDLSGCFGIDCILGPDDDGSQDRIVEVNPRPTTSMVLYEMLLPWHLGAILLQRFDEAESLPGASVRRTGTTVRRRLAPLSGDKTHAFEI